MTSMAKYLLLIFGDEQRWDAETAPERDAKDAGHRAFAAAAGPGLLGGHELDGTATATTLRAGTGEHPTPTDGPFLETKEALGGFYVIEAPDLDHALAIAKLCPAPYGCVEVRPVAIYV